MAEGYLPEFGENDLADKIRAAIGVGAFEEVRVLTPQFERLEGDEPWWTPQSAADLDSIQDAPTDLLFSLGCRVWDKEGGVVHWLYPGEWYDHIPDDYSVVTINDKSERFKQGVTDDDIRFGCLAYGFKRKEPDHD